MAKKSVQAKLEQVGADLLDVDAVRARVDAVLAEPLFWFPVRHHSPSVARHLEAVLLARKPKLVFIEGPHEANELIKHVVDPKTKPPIAIYSSYRDDNNVLGLAGVASPAEDIPPRFAAWYPLLAYSPEYVAMQTAKKIGAAVVFIDLPHHALIKPHQADAPAEDGAKPPASHHVEQEDDRLIVESGFYRKLADVAGYRTWDEAWDSMFEMGGHADAEAFRRELATFCCASRATAAPERVSNDGTLERERFMLQTIRATLAAKKLEPDQAMVVCGGFHLFLDRNDPTPPPSAPAGTVYTTVVPYSFFRISELSGYAAGNRAPQFYQLVYELTQEDRAGEIVVEHVVHVLKQARKEGEILSSADAIAASQHADMLARLRGRPAPILDDIHDALVTCCCKGDPDDQGIPLRKAMDAAGIGTKIGRVTEALGRLPLVNDFYTQLGDLELGEVLGKEKRLALDLDKREERAARRSVFLHRLRFLEVPLGEQTDAPTGDFATGKIFRERWALRWSPKIEAELIERNLYGDTVEAAVLARLHEELAKDEVHAGRSCQRLVAAIDMDLPNLVSEVEDRCSKAIDQDGRFVSLAQALTSLLVIDRYAVFRNLRRDLLSELIERCFDRACFALPEACSAPEDQQQEVVAALLALAGPVVQGDRPGLERSLFAEHVKRAAQDSTVPFLRGAFLGMLAEIRELSTAALAAEVSNLARAPVELMITAGDFLDGVMAVSRTSILLGADALIAAIDELLRAADWESFLVMLPRTRAAFERLHERQRDSLAGKVAERYGLAEAAAISELSTSVSAAAWIARIDQQVATIMEKWQL
ncbi:MAG: DUF5682 family protein [Gemmataceae bacterium]